MAVIKVSDVSAKPPVIKITIGRTSIFHKSGNNEVILLKPVI
jgi:hypothetical protein